MDNIQAEFSQRLLQRHINVSDRQLEQFELYFRELVAWNEKMNLTGITEREQVYVKHFYDSASLSFLIPMEEIASVGDIGSGAGFPGIPLRILFPHLKVTIVDSLNKRIGFLRHLVDVLSLPGVECLHGRAEELAHNRQYRDSFDLVTARAVARLNVLNEFCLPFVRDGGLFVAMKGSDPAEELEEAAFSMKELKAKLERIHSLELPSDDAKRHLVVMRKIGKTPNKYPRKPGMPLKNPLK